MRFLLFNIIFVLSFSGYALTQETQDSLTASQILQRADSVSKWQDTLLAHTRYSVKEEQIFNEMDDKGKIKKSDTTIAVVTMDGKKEVSRQIIRSTRTPDSKKEESEGEMGLPLSPDSPDYKYSLTGTDEQSYTITVIPKTLPPKKGLVSGTLTVDRKDFYIRKIDFEVPKPEGAIKEFATQMTFEPLEGRLVVMKEMKMKGFAKALLGIVKMRFTGEVRFSEYQILK